MQPIETLRSATLCVLLPLIAAACSSSTSPGTSANTPQDAGASTPDATADAGNTPDANASPDGASVTMADAGAEASTGPATAVCTLPRPQLSDAQAMTDTTLAYLAQAGFEGSLVTDNWNPTAGLGDVSTFVPTFTVAATGGTYTTVQAAIDAAVARATDGGTGRVYISVAPGTYNEVVCVPPSAPPITLYGTNADPTQTVIAFDNYNGETKAVGVAANPCTPNASATTFGTAGSATFSAFATGFQAKNLTFSNDVSLTTLSATANTQAVALMTEADKVVLENVQILGHQDTLYLETPGSGEVVRAYVKSSYIAGDVDFIFGGATAVLDTCQIQFVSDRKPNGQVLSPSTDVRNPYGLLVVNGNFTADATTRTGAVGLGRAWDRSCTDVPTYIGTCVASGDYPNGQALVRGSMLGVSIDPTPWLPAATTKRPYCNTPWACVDGDAADGVCPANRLFEYQNTGAGSAP